MGTVEGAVEGRRLEREVDAAHGGRCCDGGGSQSHMQGEVARRCDGRGSLLQGVLRGESDTHMHRRAAAVRRPHARLSAFGAVGSQGGRWSSPGGLPMYSNPLHGADYATIRQRQPRSGSRAGTQSIEDITATDPPVHPAHVRCTLGDISNLQPNERSQTSTRSKQRMPRRRNGLWTDEDLQRAMAAIDDGMNINKASKTFHIPYSSLRDWCYGVRTSRKHGAHCTRSPESCRGGTDSPVAN